MKKILLLLMVVITAFFILQCSIPDWVNFTNSPFETPPNWRVDFNVPIYENSISVANFLGSKTFLSNETPEIPVTGIWPGPADITLIDTTEKFSLIFPGIINLDGDSENSSDFKLKKLESTDGYMEITVNLTDASDDKIPIEEGDIIINDLTIQEVDYSFGTGVETEGSLVFKTTDFLTEGNPIIVTDNKINSSFLNVTLNPGGNKDPSRINLTNYQDPKLSFGFKFNYGKTWAITGDLTLDVVLYTEKDDPISIYNEYIDINPLSLKLGYTNPVPLTFELDSYFYYNNITDDTNYQIPVMDGSQLPQFAHNTSGETKLTVNDNLFDKKNLKLNMNINMKAGENVTLTNDLFFFLKIGIEANGKIDLDTGK